MRVCGCWPRAERFRCRGPERPFQGKDKGVSVKKLMFFCIPQKAYMRIDDCQGLRERPLKKGPNGRQSRLKACEFCTMHPLVDSLEVPTVSLEAYLDGARPKAMELASVSTMAFFNSPVREEG